VRPAIFFDRDGTLLVEMGYISHPSQVRPYALTAEALRLARSAGFTLVVVTNQSGVARGWLSECDLEAVHGRMQDIFRADGAALDAVYYCPHHPQATVAAYRCSCECRKPGTALGEKAIRDLGIDRKQSWVIGDKASDIKFGLALGLRACLVRTGFGASAEQTLGECGVPGVDVATDVLDAVKRAVAGREGQA
jgi:D-glycero-D-manno-heptose 1,7-bisphosphate phosphatase